MNKEHYWEFCDHCEDHMVRCGTCGNNSCNGGYGILDSGKQCTDCKSAYELMYSGKGKPKEYPNFILKYDYFAKQVIILPVNSEPNFEALKDKMNELAEHDGNILFDNFLWSERKQKNRLFKISLEGEQVVFTHIENNELLEECEHFYRCRELIEKEKENA